MYLYLNSVLFIASSIQISTILDLGFADSNDEYFQWHSQFPRRPNEPTGRVTSFDLPWMTELSLLFSIFVTRQIVNWIFEWLSQQFV